MLEIDDQRSDYPLDRCLHELVEAQADRSPDAIAVWLEGRHLSYGTLDRHANQLAHRLRALGVAPDALVGIAMESALERIVAVLGVLKAGGAYVPLDPEYPKQRLGFMFDDTRVQVLLTQEHLISRMPAHSARVLALDPDFSAISAEPDDRPRVRVAPTDLVCGFYTSGSTGQPKAALLTHRGLVNFFCYMQESYPLTPDDAVLQKNPFSFDASVWEIFHPLIAGARLVLARPGAQWDNPYLIRLMDEQKITALEFSPSALAVFIA